MVGGGFTTYNGKPASGLIRLLYDGQIDPTFKTGTGFQTPDRWSIAANSIQIQADEKLLIGGAFTAYMESEANRLIRLNPDGSRDISFRTGTGFDEEVLVVLLQSDGKILVGGRFTSYQDNPVPSLIRINPDGSTDLSFSPQSVLNNVVHAVTIQADGMLLINAGNSLIRLHPDGSKDESFQLAEPYGQWVPNIRDPDNGSKMILLNFTVQSIFQQDDGKILLAGNMRNGTLRGSNTFMRLYPDGSVDNSFRIYDTWLMGTNGRLSLTKNSEGEYYVLSDYYFSTVRISPMLPDGTPDYTFEQEDIRNEDEGDLTPDILEIQKDGKFLASGSWNGKNKLYRFNGDGTLDRSYNPKPEFNRVVYAINLQNDGKILVGGNFTSYFGNGVRGLTRIHPDGTLDATFNTGKGLDHRGFRPQPSILVQPDDRILFIGPYNTFDGNTVGGIVRLNPDGSRDESFHTGAGFETADSNLKGILQGDGKIIVATSHTNSFDGEQFKSLIRLNSDGSKDSSFDIGSGFDWSVLSISHAPGDKILVGGNFTTFNGYPVNRIVRLNSDGSLDPTFKVKEIPEIAIRKILVQSDGKILAVGTDGPGTLNSQLIRYNPDGSLDSGFNSEIPTADLISSSLLLPDSKILVSVGENSSYLIRLLPDGSIDPTLNQSYRFNGTVETMLLDPEGNLLAGGKFTEFDGKYAGRIVKIPNFFEQSSTLGAVIRINAGGPSIRFGSEEWLADTHFTGGRVYSNPVPIADTENDALYQTERFGDIHYEIPVPQPGFYTLELHFAEIHWDQAGARLFDLFVENALFKENIDLVKDIGFNTAHVIWLENLEVKDGNLSLELLGRKDQSKISGLALFKQVQPEIPETIRINTGGDAVQFGEEHWQADQFYSGGRTYTTTAPIGNTNKDLLYQSERFGDFTYEIPVTIKGTYIVELHFAEIHWSRANARLFRFRLENDPPTEIIDLYKNHGGANSAHVLQIPDVQVVDGVLNLELITEKDWAKLSGIAVYKQSLSYPLPGEAQLRVNAGGPALLLHGEEWIADAYFEGGRTYGVGSVPISNTDIDEVYLSERYGDFSYSLPAPEAGSYTVDHMVLS